ncbi:uncharacterized protein LOC129944855 [Eupeodes corollae]|uniref:uncharacterized protein LOC129944855 n=1 Tax=Eupeodes corollae TaxID=290404 RepID=UPI0024938E59|nr:uncharacterized protein LOC129944855 [Eupeodes corollae]
MSLPKVILFSILSLIISAETCHLSEIIYRIHKEFKTPTVSLVGFEKVFLTNFFMRPFEVPLEILTSPIPTVNYKNPEKSIILVVQVSLDFQKFHSFVNKIRNRKFVVIYGNTLAELHQYFFFFWEKHFTRIFGVASNKTYAYLPFADNPVQELFSPNENALPDSLKDLNGFALRTTVQADPPRVFWYTGENGQRHIGGSSGQLFVGFLKRHNATFVEAAIKNINNQPVFAALRGNFSKQIDISMNTFDSLKGLDQSYPIKLIKWGIMVPLNGYVDSSQYFLKPFQSIVWLCFGLTLIFLIVTDMLKDRLIDAPVDIWNSFSRIFLIFLNRPPQRPTINAYRFDIQVHFLAFISVNFYLIFMTSFLTVNIKIKQYETIQDLIDNNVPVKMIDFDWESSAGLVHHPEGFEKIIVLQNREIFLRELKSMKNTNFAYADGSDKLNFLLNSRLQPKFRIIGDSLQTFYLVFILSKNSPFREILNNFIFDVLSTGLLDKWKRNAVVQALSEGLINPDLEMGSIEQSRPLGLYHFKFAWTCFVIGIVNAIGVFLLEISIGRFLKNHLDRITECFFNTIFRF